MKNIINHLEYLLQSHDCVIIPGLGGVLAHGFPAFYDESRQLWVAPSRVVSFNPELSRNDGLIAASIARKEQISIDKASNIVRKSVEQMKTTLAENNTLALGSIGSLNMDDNGFLNFTPGTVSWLSPRYMWLPGVVVPRLETASEMARGHLKQANREKFFQHVIRRTSRIAAAVAVLFALGWIVVQNLTYAPEEQFASVAPVTESSSNIKAVDNAASTPVVLVLARAPKDEIIENIPSVPRVTKADKAKYYLIVASLATMADAEKYVQQHPENNLGILTKDGRFRIYAASGNSFEEVLALSKQEEIASRYPSSWICR